MNNLWNGIAIQKLTWDSEGDEQSANTKYDSTLSIKQYSETGEMAPVLWFEIKYQNIADGKIHYKRVNGSCVHEVSFVKDSDAS